MTDIRRTLLWVVFTMSLVLLWDAWNKHTGQPSLFGSASTSQPSAAPGSAASGVPAPSPSEAPVPTTGSAAPAPLPSPTPTAGEVVTVTTDLARVSFDTAGASIVKVELLKYRDQLDPRQNVVVFDRSAQRQYVAQSGLVGVTGAPTHLSRFSVAPGDRSLQAGHDTLSVRFESAETGGIKLVKTFSFKRGEYAIGVKHEVVNEGATPVSPQLYLQLVRDGNAPAGESSFYFTFTGPAVYNDASKFKKVPFKDIEKGEAAFDRKANDGWVAMVQHYFVSAWLHNAPGPREFYARKVDTNLYSVGMLFPVGTVEHGATRSLEDVLLVGPQEEKKLEALAPGLELVKDYGWVTILAKPLFWLLDKVHKVLGNWGWSIVALVVLLKIAFYWLNASAYRSMAKMKAINPRVMELRERHKDNPQQMQQEMMRIYREEKVNPLGGCLPILVQIPFFIALYWVLLSSVEMRQAPWIGWITDLSAKDPYYVLPLLMTGSTLLQTWLNPTPPDPVQAKMMWIMPLVFSVMFFVFPAGLVLYWLTNNLLSIAQQWVINRSVGVGK
jgi:YidC/Oxa1 family membrane protein insertase